MTNPEHRREYMSVLALCSQVRSIPWLKPQTKYEFTVPSACLPDYLVEACQSKVWHVRTHRIHSPVCLLMSHQECTCLLLTSTLLKLKE